MTSKPFGKRNRPEPCVRKTHFVKASTKPLPSYQDLMGTPPETPVSTENQFGFSLAQYVVGGLVLMALWMMITGSAINHATKEGLGAGDRLCETIYYDAIQRRDCMAQNRYIITGKRY